MFIARDQASVHQRAPFPADYHTKAPDSATQGTFSGERGDIQHQQLLKEWSLAVQVTQGAVAGQRDGSVWRSLLVSESTYVNTNRRIFSTASICDIFPDFIKQQDLQSYGGFLADKIRIFATKLTESKDRSGEEIMPERRSCCTILLLTVSSVVSFRAQSHIIFKKNIV